MFYIGFMKLNVKFDYIRLLSIIWTFESSNIISSLIITLANLSFLYLSLTCFIYSITYIL